MLAGQRVNSFSGRGWAGGAHEQILRGAIEVLRMNENSVTACTQRVPVPILNEGGSLLSHRVVKLKRLNLQRCLIHRDLHEVQFVNDHIQSSLQLQSDGYELPELKKSHKYHKRKNSQKITNTVGISVDQR